MNASNTPLTQSAASKLFFFQLGPVHEFISQARSTRDLWSGSYLISWMTGRVIQELKNLAQARGLGQPELIFSQLEGEHSPMMRWIEGARDPAGAKAATLPTVPNRFLACVPPTFGSADAEQIVRAVFSYETTNRESSSFSEWEKICEACRGWFAEQTPQLLAPRKGLPEPSALWHRQLAGFWQPSWLLWPAADDDALSEGDQRKLFESIPVGRRWRTANPSVEPSFWMVRYHLALHRFEARRQTHNFDAWVGHGIDKDSLSGKEEAIASANWLKEVPRGRPGKSNPLNHILRKDDPLGAPNLVKRVWHKAYLEEELQAGGMGLSKERLERKRGSYFDIPSVPGIAAFPWARTIWARHKNDPFGANNPFDEFWQAVEAVGDFLPLELPKRMEWKKESASDWLARVDWQVFREEFWTEQVNLARTERDPDWEEVGQRGQKALEHFVREEKCGSPGRYYAVLAGDGDSTSRWLSGERPDHSLFDVKPDFHWRLSRGIAEFSAVNSRLSKEIEDLEKKGTPFQGKVIYAGGEDVLAILPAEQAINGAQHLRKAFQRAMQEATGDAGFTYSVGLAIGHIKEPLQDMVEAARNARDYAKNGLGRNALAVVLFKRSGETIEWGCPFSYGSNNPSAALRLLEFIQSDNRFRLNPDDREGQPPISGRFPYRLAELLEPYQTYSARGGFARIGRPTPLAQDLREIAEREVQWAIQRQCDKLPKAGQEKLMELCVAYLKELEERGAPLCDFYHLFAVEAFMARQGE
jgi:CRISPR-associated protein Cmr2